MPGRAAQRGVHEDVYTFGTFAEFVLCRAPFAEIQPRRQWRAADWQRDHGLAHSALLDEPRPIFNTDDAAQFRVDCKHTLGPHQKKKAFTNNT